MPPGGEPDNGDFIGVDHKFRRISANYGNRFKRFPLRCGKHSLILYGIFQNKRLKPLCGIGQGDGFPFGVGNEFVTAAGKN